ncbi:MAG: hypothetical protein OEW75_18165, partial [Cyclobacteriaceae bacterium]|nr:hypothetical protein [Cyclobacteriaceae bacterium]
MKESLKNILLYFSLFCLALSISPNFSEFGIKNTFLSLVIFWPIISGLLSNSAKTLSLRAFASHYSFYISAICLAIIFYFQSENPEVLFLGFGAILILFFSGKYFYQINKLVAGLLFFILCYLSINEYEIVQLFRIRLLGAILFSSLYLSLIEEKKWAMISSSLVLLAFYFYLEQPLYALGALFVSLLHFLMMYFSLLTKNVRS